jgi:hypothetical protein
MGRAFCLFVRSHAPSPALSEWSVAKVSAFRMQAGQEKGKKEKQRAALKGGLYKGE